MKTEMLVSPAGKIIDTDDFFNVDSVKWEVDFSKNWTGFSTHHLTIYYEGNTRLRLLQIEKEYSYEHLYSAWIDTTIFSKLPYYNWQTNKYKQSLIKNKIVELLQNAALDTLQKSTVQSCCLKYLYKKPKQ